MKTISELRAEKAQLLKMDPEEMSAYEEAKWEAALYELDEMIGDALTAREDILAEMNYDERHDRGGFEAPDDCY